MSFKTTFKVTYTDNTTFEGTMFCAKNPMTNPKRKAEMIDFIREFDAAPATIKNIELSLA